MDAAGRRPRGDFTRRHRRRAETVIVARERADLEPLTFGMVYPFSCHNYELRYWLAAAGIDPDRDVRLVVIPPPFLVDALRAGQIDGFCVGEPWNSVAVDAGVGAIVTPTTAFWPLSPEKVLGCRAEWAQRYPEQLARLAARPLSRGALVASSRKIMRNSRSCWRSRVMSAASAGLLHRAPGGRLALQPRRRARVARRFLRPRRATQRPSLGEPRPVVLRADGAVAAGRVPARIRRGGPRDLSPRSVSGRRLTSTRCRYSALPTLKSERFFDGAPLRSSGQGGPSLQVHARPRTAA